MTKERDQDLKMLARRSRGHALELLCSRYRDRLVGHAAGILRDREEARDAVQEVLVRAMREPRLFEADFDIRAWLFRVTSNLCFNQVRDRRRRSEILAEIPEDSAPHAAPSEPAGQSVLEDELRRGILDAMEVLTEDHREILKLRYYNDLSYNEIAERLDVRLGTVMSRLSRARGRLSEVLDEDLRVAAK